MTIHETLDSMIQEHGIDAVLDGLKKACQERVNELRDSDKQNKPVLPVWRGLVKGLRTIKKDAREGILTVAKQIDKSVAV